MSETRDHTKCRRCGEVFMLHAAVTRTCPGNPASTFQKHATRVAASQSFTPDEVQLLAFAFEGLLRGQDIRAVCRHKNFPNLIRKVQAMQRRLVGVKKKEVAA